MTNRKQEAELVLEELRKLVTHTQDPDELIRELHQHQRARAAEHLKEVLGAWHNRRGGVLALLTGVVALTGAATLAYVELEASIFDLVSKLVGLLIATIVSVALLLDEPFHEEVSPSKFGWWIRLQGHGKFVAALVFVGLWFGALGTRASITASAKAEMTTLTNFRELKSNLQVAGLLLVEMQRRAASLLNSADQLQKKIPEVEKGIGRLETGISSLEQKVPQLPTRDDLRKSLLPFATTDEVTRAVKSLATGDGVRDAVRLLATREAMDDAVKTLASRRALDDVTAKMSDLSTDVSALVKRSDLSAIREDLRKAIEVEVRRSCSAPAAQAVDRSAMLNSTVGGNH